MRLWKQSLLAAYLYGSYPLRWWSRARAASSGTAPIIVLFYHRVADTCPNAWTMPIATFQRQLQWLRRHVDLVSLQEAQRRLHGDSNHRVAVSITFDDGYADNCESALPLLIRERIPCTYFVSVQNVVSGEPFPHDVNAGEPLRPNTVEQLRLLADSGIEIGLHGRHHVDLGQLTDRDQLCDEVVVAGRDLADIVGHDIRYFAFPYGLHENLNAEAFHLARKAGYLGVCSAYGGYNLPGEDSFHLQRIHADCQWVRWLNWMTIDRRGRRSARRFNYRSCRGAERPLEDAAWEGWTTPRMTAMESESFHS